MGDSLTAWRRRPLEPEQQRPRIRCNTITDEPGVAWSAPVFMEWEIEGAGWEDLHPHDETTYLLEGELTIESGGESVTLQPGDCAVVHAHHIGRYIAPVYARMIAVYGPNPTGAVSDHWDYWEINE